MIPTNGMLVRWVICILMLLAPLAVGKDKKQQEGEALLAKARELSDIRGADAVPFRLHSRVLLWTSCEERVEGGYSLIFASRNRWREEIQFSGFRQVRLRVGDRLWRSRNVIYQPVRIQALTRILDFAPSLKLMWNEQTKKLFDRTRDSTQVKCVELQAKKAVKQTICLDSSSGVVVSRESRFSAEEFSQYAPWLGKVFPRRIRVLEGGKPALEAFVDHLAQETLPDSSLFVPVIGAEEWPTCDDPKPPLALNIPEPLFPEHLRGTNAKVLVSIVVGTDGKVARAGVLETPAPEFAAATTDMVLRAWRFRPAMCNGSAIPYEVYVDVAFRSSP